MTQPFRLPQGGAIDRSRPLPFTFNGRALEGHAGDTLASALLANGVRLVGRSFKYHRPRGIYTAGPEEPNALVRVGAGARVIPNRPATTLELYEGLAAASINCWPGVGFDIGGINNRVASLLPAGFYYKTFMWPAAAWMWYEKWIRRAAGLGRTPGAPDPDRYDKRNAFCDVLVIGGGPAGLSAALAAGRAGARVILCESAPAPGGQLAWNGDAAGGGPGTQWLAATQAALAALPDVDVLTRTTAIGYYDHNLVTLLERVTDHLAEPPGHLPRERLWKVRAKQVVVAAGSFERLLAFEGNDLPGVMLAASAQRYVEQYAVRPGTRAVVLTNNDSAYAAARALAGAGVDIAAIIDLQPESAAGDAARADGLRVEAAAGIVQAHGSRSVAGVTYAPVTADGRVAGAAQRIACDTVLVAGGWDPAVHLYSQSGSKLRFDAPRQCFVPAAAAQPVLAAGAANGVFDAQGCVADGAAAGTAAARAAGFAVAAEPRPGLRPYAIAAITEISGEKSRTKAFIDLQSDVVADDLRLAAREGYTAVEHAKRYTTTGMGVDQGKIGNIAAFALLGDASGRDIAHVGTTTFRPPFVPVSIGALAGREVGERFDPVRLTPIGNWHADRGAVMEPVGLWRRPSYYPQPGEDLHAAVARECRTVRTAAGLLDASTLGKIELKGRGAVTLLNRVYTNAWNSLKVGQCRYGLMLRENGMVFDDGVTARLGEHHYLMSTTSGGADGVTNWLEEWLQCEWRDLDVYVTPVTAQWATLCVTGPRAREVLAALPTDIDLAPDAFPHLAVRCGLYAGVPARLFRVSFTGELSYEINVPARYGRALWDALLAAGAPLGLAPFGLEALHVLRAEKGYIVVGHDTDGTVTPYDLGMDWIVSRKKGDFIGARGLACSDTAREGRKQLVGLLTEAPAVTLHEGCQLVAWDDRTKLHAPPVPMAGHVTSSYASATLGRSIAMALLANGRARMGERLAAVDRGRVVAATVTEPRFYDPEGKRLHD
jgi:sarcosine oxidase subunit alpha